MRYLLDTCVLSELTRKRPLKRVSEWLAQQDDLSLFLSVITFGELQKGIGKLPDSTKRRELQSWVDYDLRRRFEGRVLAIDHETAVRWGEISATAEEDGRRIPVLDGLLVATALVSGLTVVTRNTRHMEHSAAKLFNPWEL